MNHHTTPTSPPRYANFNSKSLPFEKNYYVDYFANINNHSIVVMDRRSRIHREVSSLLKSGVIGGVFPGATLSIQWREGDQWCSVEAAAGALTDKGAAVQMDTLYDLGSLTRLVVGVVALRLIEAEKIQLDARVDTIIQELRGSHGGEARVGDLLTHRSGLASWGALYMDMPHDPGSGAAHRWIVAESARRGLSTSFNGSKEPKQSSSFPVIPSDLGYILLGEVLTKVCEQGLESLVSQYLTGPLGITDDLIYLGALPKSQRAKRALAAAPTTVCDWRGRSLRGEPLDGNCAAMGGVAGHAGLFATAPAWSEFGKMLLDAWEKRSSLLPQRLLEAADMTASKLTAIARILEQDRGRAAPFGSGTNSRSNGHQTARADSPQAARGGLEASSFTGVSLWWETQRHLVVALMSNRIHPSPSNERIQFYRPALYAGILAAFDAA